MIRFENVTKILGEKTVLDNISFDVDKGETFVIVGPSGAGKSVILKHMVHLMTPDDGQVLIGDDVVSDVVGSDLERIRERFGVLFQEDALLAWLSVAENVALPLREKTNMGNDEILTKVHETLKLFAIENDAEKRPSELSGGMRKRVALARAIIRSPEIVLYDEPTVSLDPVTARTIDSLIEKMRQELAVTSVVVTHDLHSALSIGTRIAMLHGGKIIEMSGPGEFINSSRNEVQSFLESQFITKKGSWEGNLR